MKLFLASQASESVNDIDKFVGGISSRKIAYIVTAGNGEGFGGWRRSDSVNLVKSIAPGTDFIELENYKFDDVVSKIKNSDLIWVGGGQTGYLLYWMRRLGVDKLLREFGNEKIYVGSSAGSMAVSKTQFLLGKYIGEIETGASVIPGIGLVDFEIYPHFEDDLLPEIKKLWTYDVPLYLLKNGEAITVVDGKVNVIGEERVIKG